MGTFLSLILIFGDKRLNCAGYEKRVKTRNSNVIHALEPRTAPRVFTTHICEKPPDFITGKILPLTLKIRDNRRNHAAYEKHVKTRNSNIIHEAQRPSADPRTTRPTNSEPRSYPRYPNPTEIRFPASTTFSTINRSASSVNRLSGPVAHTDAVTCPFAKNIGAAIEYAPSAKSPRAT